MHTANSYEHIHIIALAYMTSNPDNVLRLIHRYLSLSVGFINTLDQVLPVRAGSRLRFALLYDLIVEQLVCLFFSPSQVVKLGQRSASVVIDEKGSCDCCLWVVFGVLGFLGYIKGLFRSLWGQLVGKIGSQAVSISPVNGFEIQVFAAKGVTDLTFVLSVCIIQFVFWLFAARSPTFQQVSSPVMTRFIGSLCLGQAFVFILHFGKELRSKNNDAFELLNFLFIGLVGLFQFLVVCVKHARQLVLALDLTLKSRDLRIFERKFMFLFLQQPFVVLNAANTVFLKSHDDCLELGCHTFDGQTSLLESSTVQNF